MGGLDLILETAGAWANRLVWYWQTCFRGTAELPACEEAWAYLFIAGMALASVVVIFVLRRSYRHWREMKRNEQMLRDRHKVAPPELMEEVKWRGDTTADPSLSYEDLVKRIRTAKEEQQATRTQRDQSQ